MQRTTVLLFVLGTLAACASDESKRVTTTKPALKLPDSKIAEPKIAAPKLEYPAAERQDVVDDFHGTRIADPYRWLEDVDAPATRTWIEKENALTHAFIAA